MQSLRERPAEAQPDAGTIVVNQKALQLTGGMFADINAQLDQTIADWQAFMDQTNVQIAEWGSPSIGR